MKKIIGIGILLAVILPAMAQMQTRASHPVIDRAVRKAVAVTQEQITRDTKDPRILYFLGETYRMLLGNPGFANYFPARGKKGIAIHKTNDSLENTKWQAVNVLSQQGFEVKSIDGRNPNDQWVSMLKRKGTESEYKVLRFFVQGTETIQVVVGNSVLANDSLPVMRRILQGVRNTPQKTFTAYFPREHCEFREDCYQ